MIRTINLPLNYNTRNRDNAGNAEVKNLDNDFVADTVLLRVRAECFLVLVSSWDGDRLL